MVWGKQALSVLLKEESSKDLEGKFIMTRYYKVHLCYELMVVTPKKSSLLIPIMFLWVPAVSQHHSQKLLEHIFTFKRHELNSIFSCPMAAPRVACSQYMNTLLISAPLHKAVCPQQPVPLAASPNRKAISTLGKGEADSKPVKFPSFTVSIVAYTLGLNCKTKIQRSVNHRHSKCDFKK